jgi:hypothetical protein
MAETPSVEYACPMFVVTNSAVTRRSCFEY